MTIVDGPQIIRSGYFETLPPTSPFSRPDPIRGRSLAMQALPVVNNATCQQQPSFGDGKQALSLDSDNSIKLIIGPPSIPPDGTMYLRYLRLPARSNPSERAMWKIFNYRLIIRDFNIEIPS